MKEQQALFATQIIGGGPGGLGIPIVAASEKRLTEVLRRGVAIIDGQKLGGGALCNNVIRSNSEAVEFVQPLIGSEEFYDLLSSPETQAVLEHVHDIVELGIVGRFVDRVGERIAEIIDKSSQSITLPSRVDHVVFDKGELTFTSYDQENQELATSTNLVLATGSAERPIDLGSEELNSRRVLSSDFFSNPETREWILSQLADNPNGQDIAVLGGRHSAFSAAAKLLALCEENHISLRPQAITILSKGNSKVFYNSVQEAARDGYGFDAGTDVCPVSGRVNRFRGIRGDAKALYQNVLRGKQPIVRIVNISQNFQEIEVVKNATLIIQATGYAVREVPLFDARGSQTGPQISNGRAKVDSSCNLYSLNDAVLPHVFGIGTGYGISPSPAIGGEYGAVVEALNFYWSVVGKIILDQILDEGR